MAITRVVVAFRMHPAGVRDGDGYLSRARSVRVRCEQQGGRLVAWGDNSFAFGWERERFDDVMGLVGKLAAVDLEEPSWAIGVAEGEVALLAPDGSAGDLAWGMALIGAAAMARLARSGEVIVEDEVRALREGRLAVVGERVALEGSRRVRGWRMAAEGPWVSSVAGDDSGDRATLPYVQQLATPAWTSDPTPTRTPGTTSLCESPRGAGPVEADARAAARTRSASAEDASAEERCRAALGAALDLMHAGCFEDSLLDAVDALARGREAANPEAVAACMALLAKLYDIVGLQASAVALRDAALGR